MEDESGVKAPVTRLRRRLSVEQTEEKASTPNTPTKKRTTRRAKPELDLIDENVIPETVTPKKTVRKTVKDVLEPVEEKTVTPSRRSTRIKSNTSIVLETAASISVDSPRAKRAARRNSQLGSDSETTNTPIRQTRRTRKDSTSSIDKVDAVSKPAIITEITEIIAEEPETILRKSPRLSKSPRNTSNITKPDENNVSPLSSKESYVDDQSSQDNKSSDLRSVSLTTQYNDDNKTNNIDDSESFDSTMNLINNIDKNSHRKKNVYNKSTSALESDNFKSKKKRTKSWSTVSSPNMKEGMFYSDNESKKNKLNSLKAPFVVLNKTSTGDNKLDLNVSESKLNSNVTKDNSKVLNKSEIDVIPVDNLNKGNRLTNELFNGEPSVILKPEIIIEDFDSNSERGHNTKHNNEDQCVPVVSMAVNLEKSLLDDDTHIKYNISNGSVSDINKGAHNESVEPMDIDETMPENTILPESEEKKQTFSEKNDSKNEQDSCALNTELHLLHTKSKRKSSLSHSLNKTENKSTLILSEMKDNSTNEINKSEKSLMKSDDKPLSKSAIDLDKTQNNETERKNISLSCLTSTPLQQKNFQKLIAPINTSIIRSNQDVQSPLDESTSVASKSITNKSNVESSDDESSGEESSKEKNELLNDEASDAGDDYESGDSQDEDERQYVKENEIVDKGVTLTSEEELSNDSDYEKDSFVVSSDEEDNQLLEGTDDDLSISDNELKMTAKSKKKYNERMAKQQKKASREMFEARHKLDNSKSKKTQAKDNDSSDSSEEEAPKKQIKKNRMRLDSSHETSVLSINETKATKKTKRLSESVGNESALNEKEITMHSESYTLTESDPLDTQIKQEQKTPKKDINSTVDFIDTNNANDTNINKSIDNANLSDPLHATMNEEETSSSDSDTNNIIDNYDSILNELNKNKKVKTTDMSLNLEVKNKAKNKKAPVIDELNLTQVKTVLKNLKPVKLNQKSEKAMEKIEKGKYELSKEVLSMDSSSDSIDLHLLFSEESNADSVHKDDNDVEKSSETTTDVGVKNGQEEADDCINFFIDTKGEHSCEDSTQIPDKEQINMSIDGDQSLKSNAENKKKKSMSQSLINVPKEMPTEEVDATEVADISTSKTPKSEKKKKKRLSESQVDIIEGMPSQEVTGTEVADISTSKTPKSEKKKKKRVSESQVDIIAEIPSEEVTGTEVADISTSKTPKSEKKKKKRVSESQVDIIAEIPTEAVTGTEVADISTLKTPKSEKKKKNHLSESQVDIIAEIPTEEVTATVVADISTSKTPKSEKKKKKRLSESQVDIAELPTEEIAVKEDGDSSTLRLPNSEKKKKKLLSQSQVNMTAELPAEEVAKGDGNISVVKTPKSEKKNKKHRSESQTDNIKADTLEENVELNVPKIKTPKSEKKNKSRLLESQSMNTEGNSDSDSPLEVPVEMNQPNIEIDHEETKTSSSKKKSKSKSPCGQKPSEVIDSNEDSSRKKRKRTQLEHTEEISKDVESSQSKKIKISYSEEEAVIAPEEGKKIKNKKRKLREDEDSGVSKVRKTNTLDKIPVPRLPPSIISQLDDKPKIQTKKKAKVIATSQFVIEDVRRSKPSNYLEESIYLPQGSPQKKKTKANVPKPKVLPTMPTASTSNTGYTTNFKISVQPRETQFVAQNSNVTNFREERMYNKNIKRLGTYEMYKRQRNIKLSKF